MSSDAKTSKKRKAEGSDSNRGWLIPIVVIIVLGVAATIAIVATSGDDDDGGEDSVALDEMDPADVDTTGEYGTPVISGNPLPPFEGEPNVGIPAPPFATDNLDDGRVSIGPSENVQILGFFVHTCPHCQAEVERMSEWLRENDLPPGVDMYAVSTLANPAGPNWPPSAWFFSEGWSEPVLLDDAEGSIAAAYGMTQFPYWVAVDQDMNVITQLVGELDEDTIDEIGAVAAGNPAS